jgi:LacI family transcriptional regulator
MRKALPRGPRIAKLETVTNRKFTIDDVAEAAGVARVTVSRVLNNEQNVRPETREKVRRAVEELGYSVNQQARALASGSGRTILLIHSHDQDREPNSYYHSGLELGALRACSSLGYELVTRAVDPANEKRGHLLSSIIERERPAGIVLPPPLSDDVDLLLGLKEAGVRVDAVSAGEESRDVVSSAGIDERAGGETLGRYLVSLGHRQVGFLKGPEDHLAAALRYDGFLDAFRAAGLSVDPWTANGDFTFKSGVEAGEKLLREGVRITVLACANDDMAAGAMLALHRAGVAIPGEMSVTGFDDTPMSEIVWPPLTTIRQPIKDIAERAVHMLVENHIEQETRYEALKHELVVRESTAAPAQQSAA